jgi:DNA-directed RNA polymerase II subunit RPB2
MDETVRAESLIKTYFQTQDYPFTRHHIESFDQFVSQDMPAIIRAENPFTLLQNPIGTTGIYAYKAEIFVGGINGDKIYIGTPAVNLKESDEIRVLFPNEARLRNLSYSSSVEVDLVIRLTFSKPNPSGGKPLSEIVELSPEMGAQYAYLSKFPLFSLPIMLHSRYCLLHGKPQMFLKEAGECIYDSGGYFIIGGSEKVLVTSQEQAFNTLNIVKQNSPTNELGLYAAISCLNSTTRQIKRVSFGWLKNQSILQVSLPFVRKPLPLFVLFRAMGLQSDQDIIRAILPDPNSAESEILEPLLHESILDAFPFLDTYSAIQYIKVLTKGFSEAHVLNILYNQTFIHVENRPGARLAFLADCVRRILRVLANIDKSTDRDDLRNQRCITSGVLVRSLFQGAYLSWKKSTILTIDKEYQNNRTIYADTNFQNLFQTGSLAKMFRSGTLSESIMRGFKGKWGTRVGDEKTGVIQPLSRLSYLDFMSHCRRVVLDFDTGMKMAGPRRLHTSQFGYFCTSETPGGASIGITKNLSMLTSISIATDPTPLIKWLLTRGEVLGCDQLTLELNSSVVGVYVNSGIVGYTLKPQKLKDVLKALKWTGCLPASTSISFAITDKRLNIFVDEGRPIRPLIHLGEGGSIPTKALKVRTWRDLIMGVYPYTQMRGIYQSGFVDPLVATKVVTLADYMKELQPYAGAIEYVDPNEANEAFVAMYAEYIQPESSHLEIHPSTIVGLLTSIIPFPNHNQSPRNQLSCSQSKQGLSVYATNYMNRFDNMVHVLSYGEAPLVRTLYYDYLADGQMPYGQNLMVAIGCFTGYNQEDGIVFNADSFQRGMFRNMTFRSYEVFEEGGELGGDSKDKMKTRIANPARIPGWTSLKPGVDYSKLDDRGIIRVGEYVDENTVLVGMYSQTTSGDMRDASMTAQVWTTGRVEKIAVMTNNLGRALVKIRVIQDRVPELGDKFSTRHGQKGTIGMLVRAHDMPRTKDGMVPDMIVNPHCMPSRMTMAQLLESLMGKAAPDLGAIGNATAFMNEGNPSKDIGKVLQDQLGMQALGDDILYDGMSGQQVPSSIFMGNIYIMRLKHMPEDKWNARGEGRREQRTHQPTGGRGNQGGLRIGEMERDAIVGHGVMDFVRESYMKRADGYATYICNGCGTIPIYNEGKSMYICPMCDGPVEFIGNSAVNLDILPPNVRSLATFSKVEIPYSMKLLDQELGFFMNIGMRVLTAKDVSHLRSAPLVELTADQQRAAILSALPERLLKETVVPERIEVKAEPEVSMDDMTALGAIAPVESQPVNAKVLNAAMTAAVNAALGSTSTSPSRLQSTAINAAVNAAINAANSVDTPAREEPLQPLQTLQFTTTQLPQFSDTLPIDQDDYESLDAPQNSLEQNSQPFQLNSRPQNSNGINVQTSTQPVLVVPMNVAQNSPAQYIQSPAPGAPPTLAVDTSESAMRGVGNQAVPKRAASQPRSAVSSQTPANVKVNVVKGE